ncbi:DUF1015 domain-containing protein [Balneolaceae bacterium YR4-1]|uniref:DUF1015 domain-containing protein n=1 Tax=Halalkalibaculum roseum TaxID=2709311 RepID=A0A6M1SWK8_9BACT|nr:DUF1015 domain-containing protein [Halalkalibaculum roseum]NGP77322.1 DUF1015 domain-containing protein [Halalkalibaculum roseum]
MAIIHPFKAWRPTPDNVREVACVPYDVISSEEARKLAAGKPNSFLHVIRPEIDLPKNIDFNDDRVYHKGAENLKRFISKNILQQENERAVYIYRLIMNGRSQTGVFTCVSVEDYDNEVILKHELTRPVKEDDRTRHILTQSAHAEPVMMTYKDEQSIDDMVEDTMEKREPIFDFKAEDGVQHTVWKSTNSDDLARAFQQVEHLYIADGHHRCKSASRAAEEKKEQNKNHTGSEEYNFFPAVLFPMSQMEILAYNRILHSVPNDFKKRLKDDFEIIENASPKPANKGEISVYMDGEWFGLRLPLSEDPNSVEQLDAHRLQAFILQPMLGINDPRRDDNISFVGGIRGTGELEDRVDSGKAAAAFSMYPTSIEELVEVSDEKMLMPPKSTWFEPKLRSGLLVHTF